MMFVSFSLPAPSYLNQLWNVAGIRELRPRQGPLSSPDLWFVAGTDLIHPVLEDWIEGSQALLRQEADITYQTSDTSGRESAS